MAGATPRHPAESEDLLREAATRFECVHAPDASVELPAVAGKARGD